MLDLTRRTLLLGLGVFVVALLVRLIGIGWGLPNDIRNQSLHPDEPVVFAASQQIKPAEFDFVPGFYSYGTLYLTLLRVTTDIVDAYGGGAMDNSEVEMWRAVGRADLAGRVLSAVAGAATAWIVFLMLWPRVGMLGSLFGSAAMAFAPGHVVHSRFQTVDVLATFLLTVSLFFALRMLSPPGGEAHSDRNYLKWAMWAGLFAGLSAGTKYTGVLALVALVAVVLLERRKGGWKALVLGTVAAGVVFLLTTPGAVLDSARFMRDFTYEMGHTQTGHGLVFVATPSGFVFHLWNLFVAFGFVLTLFGVAGLARAGFRRHAWAIALLAFAVVYYFVIGRAEVKFMRYVFPLLPVLAVGYGWLLARAHSSPKIWLRGPLMFVGILGLGGLFGGGIAKTAQVSAWMAGEDPRDETARELKQASDDSTVVGLASDAWFYTPPLYPNTGVMRAVPFAAREAEMALAVRPRLVQYVPSPPEERFSFDARLLTDLNPDYVVFSSFEIGDLNRLNKLPSPPSEYKIQIKRAGEFMDTLKTRYERWKVRGADAALVSNEFSGTGLPHDMAYIRPEIQVWKRKTDSPTPSSGSSTTSAPSGGRAPTR